MGAFKKIKSCRSRGKNIFQGYTWNTITLPCEGKKSITRGLRITKLSKSFTQDPGITILGSQLTGLARLSCNRNVDFCCVYLRCRDLCKACQPGSCNQVLSCIGKFYVLPLTSTIFQSPRARHKISAPPPPPPPPPSTFSYPLLYIK